MVDRFQSVFFSNICTRNQVSDQGPHGSIVLLLFSRDKIMKHLSKLVVVMQPLQQQRVKSKSRLFLGKLKFNTIVQIQKLQ